MSARRKESAGVTRRRFVQGVGSLGLGAASISLSSAAALGNHEQVQPVFLRARPVWPKGLEEEKNLFVGFRADFECPADEEITLRITASTIYRCFLNGNFCGYGPARAGRGHYRVDELDLTEASSPGKNIVAIEVAGYNVNSYYLLDQPSFLQAEVRAGDAVLAATGSSANSFHAILLPERVRKVQRYSFQRPFSEVYRLRPEHDAWKARTQAQREYMPCGLLPPKPLLHRQVPNPQFNLRQPRWTVRAGKVEIGHEPEKLWKDRSLTGIGPTLKGFKEEELETIPSIELQSVKTLPGRGPKQRLNPRGVVSMGEQSYAILDFGTNLTGFLGAKITARRPTRLFLTFDEILSDGDVDFKRLQCVNIVLYEMGPGTYQVEAFEPYTMRYLKLIVLAGECDVEGITLREYANPEVERAHFAASDERLNRLFAAGRETYRQNAVDLLTDCPSRERGGWLCDSYFTAQTAQVLSGDMREERNFLENFLLAESFPHLPKGMLPMCYPADHNDGNFIPNWALWFVLQLEDYLRRSGDGGLVEALRPRVLDLFEYFRPFKNEDGLLEKLKGWIFVEWSAANDFVQDVNYPTNMLYAAALQAAAKMYALPKFQTESEKIRSVIRQQSFDGTFFVDNAVRESGTLRPTRNRTEVCQYSAFYFDVATPETHPELWRIVREDLGPRRKETKAFPDIHQANAFIGNVMRLELLSRTGLTQQILDESVAFLLYMADRTGTLWENAGTEGSCNHAFASHVVKSLYRDVLGLYDIDALNKVVHLRLPEVQLEWCEGRVPVAGGVIALTWRQREEKKTYRVQAPAGYRILLEGKTESWMEEE